MAKNNVKIPLPIWIGVYYFSSLLKFKILVLSSGVATFYTLTPEDMVLAPIKINERHQSTYKNYGCD